MLLFGIFTLFVLNEAIKGQFVKSKSTSMAQHARGVCTLAEPQLTVSADDYTLSISTFLTERLWVGYAKMYKSFLYKGCAKKNVISKIGNSIMNIKDPGQCFSHCDSDKIGIGENFQCFCLGGFPRDSSSLKETKCSAKCSYPPSAFCGETNHVSIYEKVKHPSFTPLNIITEYCLTYEPYGQSYEWKDCTHGYRWLCDGGTLGLKFTNNSNWTWADATSHCLSQGWLPAGLSLNLTSIQKNHTNLWMGTIQGTVVQKLSDEPCSVRNYKQGFTVQIDGKQKLLFNQTNEELHSLCLEDTNQPNTNTPGPSITKTTERTTAKTTTNAGTIGTVTKTETKNSEPVSQTTTLSSTAGSHHPVSDGNETTARSKGDNGKVAVYVVIPIALLVVAVVTVLIVLKMRGRCDSIGGRHKDAIKRTALDSVTNAAYQDDVSISQIKGAVNHDNVLFEPTNEYAAIRDTETEGVEENEYDTAKKVHTKANDVPGSGNIYNRLDEVTDDTYNHCNKETTLVGDDTYNHIEGGNKFGSASYSRGINSAGMRSADDTYSHIATKSSAQANTTLANRVKSHTYVTEDENTYNHTGAFDAKSPAKAFKPDSSRNPVAQAMGKKYSEYDNGRPNYDYAFATTAKDNAVTKPRTFTVSQLPNSGDYDLAKAPQTTSPGYELAKSIPIYLELSNE